METGICIRPLIPVRQEASERSEMVTQLLFGQSVDVQEQHEGWSRIRNREDGYCGWVTTKMLLLPDASLLNYLASLPCKLLREPFTTFCSDEGETLFLPAGSIVFFHADRAFFPCNDGRVRFFKPVSPFIEINEEMPPAELLVLFARKFLYAPYLWGGKSILGMDCSGLVQLSASLVGIALPRDASQQVNIGETVLLEDSQPGDLAFFSNSAGSITHVGILTSKEQILHASGCVHVDTLDEKGIYSAELKEYTHELSAIRRIV